jgi:hypothetical protein
MVPEAGPGIYAVALTVDTNSMKAALDDCPVSETSVRDLLNIRPELRLDGQRPSVRELRKRLAGLWLPDETVLYIGLAGTSLRQRVGSFYTTPLGARRPHAGGWPLKTLRLLPSLFVHYAACSNPAAAEQAMLIAFVDGVSASSRAGLHDQDMPIPFANLERRKGQRKRHGITGARAPRIAVMPASDTPIG